MSVIVELSIFPIGTPDGLSHYVARVINLIKGSGLPYKLGPMGTAIEGEWDAVMAVVGQCYHELEQDCDRLYVNIKADCRKGRTNGLSRKVASVESKVRDAS